jgi:hypothetical protein
VRQGSSIEYSCITTPRCAAAPRRPHSRSSAARRSPSRRGTPCHRAPSAHTARRRRWSSIQEHSRGSIPPTAASPFPPAHTMSLRRSCRGGGSCRRGGGSCRRGGGSCRAAGGLAVRRGGSCRAAGGGLAARRGGSCRRGGRHATFKIFWHGVTGNLEIKYRIDSRIPNELQYIQCTSPRYSGHLCPRCMDPRPPKLLIDCQQVRARPTLSPPH